MCRSLDESWGYLNQYKQRQIQGYLWSARNLYNNMKYFVTTIMRYLSTDVIAPLVTRFEEELPQYATIDAFAAGFERFLQQVYEQCFLISDRLRVSLVDTMGVCLSFVRFIKEELKDIAKDEEVLVDVKEIRVPEVDATLVAESIAQQLERRVAFRRAMKRAIQTAMERGAEGVRIRISGRLGGAELARVEQYKEGKVPLHTLSANIDYGFVEAHTLAGLIGIKVWICKPENWEEINNASNAKTRRAPKGATRNARGPRNAQ